jgi:low affinity Fe/Cu permease
MGREHRERIIVTKTDQLTTSSRWLHKVDHYTSLPWATLALGALLFLVIVVGAVLGYPPGWTIAFEVGTASVTLMMVTIIQHTQGREQTATQRKLDELLRAMPEAESSLIMLEEESDETIKFVEAQQRGSKDQRA